MLRISVEFWHKYSPASSTIPPSSACVTSSPRSTYRCNYFWSQALDLIASENIHRHQSLHRLLGTCLFHLTMSRSRQLCPACSRLRRTVKAFLKSLFLRTWGKPVPSLMAIVLVSLSIGCSRNPFWFILDFILDPSIIIASLKKKDIITLEWEHLIFLLKISIDVF